MSSIKISWIFHFFNCLILLTVSGERRPGVRTLLTTRGLNLVRKLIIPVIIKELNNLEIPPISGNVDFFVGSVNYKFKNITLSDIKIPESHLSMLNNTGLSVTGTRINIELDELWSYEFTSWPFISDKGSATVSGNEISLDVIIGISKSGKDQPSITANDCSLNIGNLDVEFRGGASFLYNFFMTFIKDQLKSQIEEVICRIAIKEVNKEINAALSTIPDKIAMVNDTVEGNFEPVCPPRFLHNGLELNFKGDFHNVQHPKTPPYTPEELPPIRNEHSRMLFVWITSYTINTMFFAVYQTRSQYYMFTSEDLPDDVPVRLNTNVFMLIVPQLFQKYPNKDMAISYKESAPAEITLNPDDGSVTFFGDLTFYVILDDDRLVNCFVLNVIEVADIEDVLIFEKDNYSYIGLKLSSSRTEVTLKETHIGNFDVALLQFTVQILSEFIMSRYISPRMEEGFRLPLPKRITVFNGDSVIGKDYILIFTDFEISRE